MNYKIDPDCENQIKAYQQNEQAFYRTNCETIGDALFKTKYRGVQFYRNSAISSAIHIINLMNYRVGVELGVSYAHSTVTILEQCDGLQKLYAVDCYKPYEDYYTSNIEVDKYDIDIIKNIALKTLSNTLNKDKLILIIEDSDLVVDKFDDEELDFAFLDAHLNSEHIKKDLQKWYPKVRKGGMVAIHDTCYQTVLDEIQIFMKENNFSGKFSNYDNLACLIKS
jgi:predicted O-methyltransferase YrrM